MSTGAGRINNTIFKMNFCNKMFVSTFWQSPICLRCYILVLRLMAFFFSSGFYRTRKEANCLSNFIFEQNVCPKFKYSKNEM